jgi:exopolysaccharide biosynthesis polyprenyl glycosylphosphotransferase
MVNFSLLFSFWLRFHLKVIPAPRGVPALTEYFDFRTLSFITLVWLIVFKALGLYERKDIFSGWEVLGSIFKPILFSLGIIFGLAFFYRDVSYSRVMVVVYFFCNVFFLFLGRLVVWKSFLWWQKKRKEVIKLAIVGEGALAENIVQRIEMHPELGYQFAGFVSSRYPGPAHWKILGHPEELREILKKVPLDEVFILTKNFSPEEIFSFISTCDELKVEPRLIPDLVEMMTSKVAFEDFKGIPTIRVKEIPLRGINLVIKRAFDIFFSVLLLFLFAPLMVLIAILIKKTSPGSVFYKQERIGRDGKRFTLYKFRSMVEKAEQTKPVWSTPDDPRVTPIGRFLRKRYLDELPQLINVLKGDMSLVGPRPERPYFVEQFREFIPRYLERHKVKSGLTGWAQVNGLRGDTLIEQRVKYDLYYIENWSLWLDFKILLRTLGLFIAPQPSL